MLMSGVLRSSNSAVVSCNFPSLPATSTTTKSQQTSKILFSTPSTSPSTSPPHLHTCRSPLLFPVSHRQSRRVLLLVGRTDDGKISGESTDSEDSEDSEDAENREADGGGDVVVEKRLLVGENVASTISDWTTSVFLFGVYTAILYYAVQLSPNQTPSRDMYFIQKLLNLKGNDGFEMNQVLVALWYIMGLWPLVYCMLLLPTARSSRGKIPVWPFLVFSFFVGAFALIPYFILWNPPPPPIEEEELKKWPLNFLESKITSGILLSSGLVWIIYAFLAGADVWTEFYQYFRESKLVHVTSLDCSMLSGFSAFWVYNDMTARRWLDKGYWLVIASLIPFLGPALYLLLRPSLSALPSNAKKKN